MLRKMLATITMLALLLPALAAAQVEKFKVDPVHSELEFTVRHFVSKVSGRFDQFEGDILVDPKDPSTLVVSGTARTSSIDTDNTKRDEHLRSADFFNAAVDSVMAFKSKKVTKSGENFYAVVGDLTMHGVTKEVTLQVEVLGFGFDRAGFEARGKVNRKDFGINWNHVLDNGGTVLGDDVDLVLQIEAKRDKPEQAKR